MNEYEYLKYDPRIYEAATPYNKKIFEGFDPFVIATPPCIFKRYDRSYDGILRDMDQKLVSGLDNLTDYSGWKRYDGTISDDVYINIDNITQSIINPRTIDLLRTSSYVFLTVRDKAIRNKEFDPNRMSLVYREYPETNEYWLSKLKE